MRGMTVEELLPLAAKAMGITWPQYKASGSDRSWNPAESNDDCMEAIFKLGLVVDPLGFNSLAEFRHSILLRMAYLGAHA